ncbi:hypothetical protein JCM11641_007499 [Rhodosporidiobolus odoratus]
MPLPYPSHRTSNSDSSTRSHTSIPSISLSPISPYPYASESDPFLSPRLSPSHPGSPFLRPSSPRTPSALYSPFSSPLNSPSLRDGAPQTGFFDHITIPPTAKRARSRTWLIVAGGALLFVAFVGLTSRSVYSEQFEVYSTKVSNGMAKVKEWSGSIGASAGGESASLVQSQVDVLLEEESHGGEEVPVEIPIITLPKPRLPNEEESHNTRYIGFLPHSGYHNQRIALQNALLLGKLLNRTVLVPPVWVGWPVPTQFYSELRQSWLNIMLLNPSSFNLADLTDTSSLNPPGDYPTSAFNFPCPACDADNSTLLEERAALAEARKQKYLDQGLEVRLDGYPIVPGRDASNCKSYSPECRFTYQDTFLAWDFLVDLDRAKAVGVEVVDRWDIREKALEELLGVGPEDVYIVEDRQAYDFRFTDELNSDAPLISNNTTPSHFLRDVSIGTLQSYQQKVLLVGSLFGSGRVVASRAGSEAWEWQEAFGRAMAFKNPWLMRPADAIVARLGGQSNFVGVHARVGDGEFQRHARQNCEQSWRKMVRQEMGVRDEVLEEMWERVKPAPLVVQEASKRKSGRAAKDGHLAKVKRGLHDESSRSTHYLAERSAWADVDGEYQHDFLYTSPRVEKRSVFGPFADWWATVNAVEPSSRLRNLTCRGPLHTEARFRPFNVPLYLATDSRSPDTDENLRPFFGAFPCTFILSDFDRPDLERNDGVVVRSVNEMSRLVNQLDGVSLGRLFLPFLEAIVAAKAKLTVGTAHSTFSGFAETHLHRAYWDASDGLAA